MEYQNAIQVSKSLAVSMGRNTYQPFSINLIISLSSPLDRPNWQDWEEDGRVALRS